VIGHVIILIGSVNRFSFTALGYRCTLKKALASDCDEMGVQFNIGRRTLLAATRRLNDGLPSEKKVWFSREICMTSDTETFTTFVVKQKQQ